MVGVAAITVKFHMYYSYRVADCVADLRSGCKLACIACGWRYLLLRAKSGNCCSAVRKVLWKAHR